MTTTQFKAEVRSRFEEMQDLPTLPEITQKVLELRAAPEPDVGALAKVIELDPSLSAQVIRYARSSLYGYRGNIDNVESATARVLGYDTVLNLALGLATAKPFEIPSKGPLGSEAYWVRSVHNAVMSQSLAQELPRELGVLPSVAYLSGLLHEFGLLAVGHLFPNEYAKLNEVMWKDPDTDLHQLEREMLGITHAEAGARILRFWDLPDEVVVTNLKHPDADFDGVHYTHANLIHLANCLMCTHEDELATIQEHLPRNILDKLELDADSVIKILRAAMTKLDDLDAMVRQLAA